jgi:hypothetical protein
VSSRDERYRTMTIWGRSEAPTLYVQDREEHADKRGARLRR